MTLDSKLSEIKGVGPKLAETFAVAGLTTVYDLLNYFPRKYDDYSQLMEIKDIRPGLVAINVKFINVKTRRVRRSLHITDAEAIDDTGRVKIVWFNQPYRHKAIQSGTQYVVKGNYELKSNRLQIINPSVEIAKDVTGSNLIVATYSERYGIKSHQIRKVIKQIFDENIKVTETLPEDIIKNNKLLDALTAYRAIHQPHSPQELEDARYRFAFEELFIVMMASELIKQDIKKAKAMPISFNQASAVDFVANLPFKLTDSQRKVVWQVYNDISKEEPMNRLVEGDVGSGKTVVAAMAILMALESGKQACLIAPTEILARQHYETIKSLLLATKYKDSIYLLTGSMPKADKNEVKNHINNKDSICLIGTHALLQKDINWQNLGLVVVDEQHRFGVNQRQSLHTSSKYVPHTLCLTATPIPRSLALTVYGELDISILDKPPTTKAGYSTSLVSPNSTTQMYDKIKKSLDTGRQAYIVCPLVEDSEILNVKSAEQTYKELSQKEFKGYNIGLVHGKLKPKDKEKAMAEFKAGKIDVLVATTVIEVGVDVPNATDMVVLSAERFGLAQLHQLRGRVGRGAHKGHCYLVMTDSDRPSARMHVLESTNDGFKLAQYDLDLRGPGAIYGTRQHGEIDLRFVNLADTKLIATVKQAVLQNVQNQQIMLKYPKVADRLQKTLQLTYLN